MSHRRVQNESDELLYTVWLVTRYGPQSVASATWKLNTRFSLIASIENFALEEKYLPTLGKLKSKIDILLCQFFKPFLQT